MDVISNDFVSLVEILKM